MAARALDCLSASIVASTSKMSPCRIPALSLISWKSMHGTARTYVVLVVGLSVMHTSTPSHKTYMEFLPQFCKHMLLSANYSSVNESVSLFSAFQCFYCRTPIQCKLPPQSKALFGGAVLASADLGSCSCIRVNLPNPRMPTRTDDATLNMAKC